MSLELVENGMSIVLPPNRHSNNNNSSSSSTDTDNETMDVVVAPPLTTTSSTQTIKQQKRKRNRRHTVQTSTSNNKRRDTIQLFAFDSDVTSNTGENVSTGRPRRTVSYYLCFVFCITCYIEYQILTHACSLVYYPLIYIQLKAIQKFDPNSYKSSSNNGLKTGHGFSCPKCSSVCSYDSKSCDNCGLGCYYEAGVGVVTLKERSVGDSAIKKGNGRQSMRTPRMMPGSATQRKKKQRGTTHNTRSSRRNTTHNTRSSRRGNRSGDDDDEEEEVAQVLAGFAEETAEAMSPDVVDEEGSGGDAAGQKNDDEEVDNSATAAGQKKKNDEEEEDVPQDKNVSLVEEYKLKFEETTNLNMELTEQMTTLQENYDDTSNLLQEKDAALDDLGIMHQTVSEERDRLEERLETLSGELTSAQMNVIAKSHDLQNLRNEIDNMRNEHDATKERMKELKSSSDSTNDRLTAEKDALVLQLEEANAKIETITAEREKYRAEKDKAMNTNTFNNMDNDDGGTIAQLQLEIEGLKQKLATANSQIATISNEKTSIVTKLASVLEPELAKLSNKQDLDDEARSNQEDSTSVSSSSSSTAVGAPTNNNNLLNMSRNISMEEEEEDSEQPQSNKVDLNMSRNVSMEEEEEESQSQHFQSQQNKEDMDDITASPVSTSKNNGAILSPRKQMSPNIKIKSANKRRDSSLSTKGSINFDESTSFSTKPKPSRSSEKEDGATGDIPSDFYLVKSP